MSERRSEKDLRGGRSLFGVRMRLMDGACWTIPPMPANGPQHPWFKAKGKAFEELMGNCGDSVAAYNKALVAAVKKSEAEREAAVDALAEGEELEETFEPDLTEAEMRKQEAAAYDEPITEMSLDLAFAALKLNYPEMERERDFDGLLTVQHLTHVWLIVNGQRETQDLFPDEGSDPPIA